MKSISTYTHDIPRAGLAIATAFLGATLAFAVPAQQSFADEADGASATAPVEEPAETTVPTGWQVVDGATCYYKADGTKALGMTKIEGKSYYFDKTTGAMATNTYKVQDKKGYRFGANGVASSPKKGFFTAGGKKYYCKGSYKLMTGGWKVVGKKAYHFNKDGHVSVNTKVSYLKVGKSGALGSAYVNGIKVLNKQGWNLKAAYKYAYKTTYANRWMRKSSSEKYANVGFNTRRGNCYVMAAQFYVMGKLLGYDIHQIEGKVNRGAPHSWTVIVKKGKERVYDPNFRNETGRKGWNIYYGKSGTWRYTNYHRMN